MPSARKRTLQEVGAKPSEIEERETPSMLHRIRNMWQFANVFQFVMLFGKALKIDDDFAIDDLEAECLNPQSTRLQDIGLSLLKFLSSHRGLANELFDEYTRRQYQMKAPEIFNPFGAEESPNKFAEFDIYTKLRVLHQMTQFVMMYPERLRERTEEQKDSDQTTWRIEPYGWDSDDRTYYILDDNRIYRLTNTPPAAPKRKKNSKKTRTVARSSKRRKVSQVDEAAKHVPENEEAEDGEPEDNGLGGMRWECLAVTLADVQRFLATLQKTRDDNEKVLRARITDHLVPILEKQEESKKRKLLQREKELLNLEKMAHAKRSSRLAKKVEHQREEEQYREEERKRREEELAAKKEEQNRLKMERERDNRLMGRERRLKEREAKRRQHEEELARLSEDSKSVGGSNGRLSERQLQAAIARKQQALQQLKELEEEEEEWMFDCVCGVHGKVDDGTHSVACECCNVWQHSKCLGIAEGDAEQNHFHFICASCRRKQAEAGQAAKPMILKLKMKRTHPSPPAGPKAAESILSQPLAEASNPVIQDAAPVLVASAALMQPPSMEPKSMPTLGKSSQMNGDDLATAASAHAELSGIPPLHSVTGKAGGNAFSSPHPALSPPDQSPNKSKAYGSIFEQSSPATNGIGGPSKAGTNPTAQPIFPPSHSSLSKAAHGLAGSPHMDPQGQVSSVATKKPSPVLPPIPDNSPPGHGNRTPAEPTPASSFTSLTPGASHLQTPSAARNTELPSPLPPPQGGVSPTKHSPPIKQDSIREGSDSVASVNGKVVLGVPSPIQPPVALSPSPQPRNLAPPVKAAEPAKGKQATMSSSPTGQILKNFEGSGAAIGQ